jgi:eukaryotic-like serine/threonine-protein kinase
MIGFTWYIAADYCNWLSEQEGLPKNQWCYLPAEGNAYHEGMTDQRQLHFLLTTITNPHQAPSNDN